MKTKIFRHVHLIGATGANIRTAVFEEREHLVVPIAAMTEGVIWPVNAESPELVLAERLAVAPAGWNGRPVFYDHPELSGEKVSGNDPKILEKGKWGITFNAASSERVLTTKMLSFEAWLDPKRAALVGAMEAIERIKAGEIVEVSIGALVTLTDAKGEWNGIPYFSVWEEVHADHLAILPPGVPGACSPAMGCGVRAAAVHLITAKGITPMPSQEFRKEKLMPAPTDHQALSLRQRLMRVLGIKVAAGVGDSELHRLLDAALLADEPGYLGIGEVFQDDNLVVYATAPANEVILYRRGYAFADGAVTLKGDKKQVEPVTRFEEVAASAAQPQPSQQPCGCATGRGATMKTNAERVAALIANTGNAFTEDHRLFLETCTADQLTALETKPIVAAQQPPPRQPGSAPPAAPPAGTPPPTGSPSSDQPGQPGQPGQQPPTRSAEAQDVTLDALLAKADPDTQSAFQNIKAAAASRKAASIAALKASGRNKFTDEQLNAKSQQELDTIVELAGLAVAGAPVDFTGRHAGTPPSQGDADRVVPKPPDLYGAVRAARGQKQETVQ